MKRIIDGVACNTKTAQLVAERVYEYQTQAKYPGRGYTRGSFEIRRSDQLYRTRTGAFFFVEMYDRLDENRELMKGKQNGEFELLTYDEAYEYVRSGELELVAEGIFPSQTADEGPGSQLEIVR